MALQNRKRHFTEETLTDIRNNLKTPTESYTELSTWWKTYGDVFDTADPMPEIQYLENFMTEFREFMGSTAPAAPDTIVANVSAVEQNYVTQTDGVIADLKDYGKALDVLIEEISSPTFATSFDKTTLLNRVLDEAPLLANSIEEKQAFIDNIKEQYGFDDETATIMWKVWQGIRTANPNATPQELSYIYTRAMSQLFYNKGDSQDGQWRAGAGYVYGYDDDEKWEYFKKLGLSEKDYKLLNYNVRLQSVIVADIEKNSLENLYEFFKNKDNDKKRNYYNRKEQMEKGVGRTLTDDEFLELWGKYYGQYTMKDPISGNVVAKTDFAHQMYTIAGALVEADAPGVKESFPGFFTSLITGKYWTDEEGRKQYIGWLGDATFAGANNDGISFGADDYASDLDADNIRKRMEADGYKKDVVQVSQEYYAELADNPSLRTQEFKQNNPYENVEQQVLNAANVKTVEDLKEKDGWGDSYNFLISLKNDEYIMQDHINQ